VENQHYGWWVVVDNQGTVVHNQGDIDNTAVFLRSTAKPFQALPLIEAGHHQQLTSEELAIICASHTGSHYHQGLVQSILAKGSLTADMLQCGCHWPIDIKARQTLYQTSQTASTLHHNCSGKHAGMLFYSQQSNFPTATYLNPAHPLQKEILRQISEYSGCSKVNFGVDGCSAPAFRLPIGAGARLFAALASEPVFKPIITAMTTFPDAMGGCNRIDTEIIRASDQKLLAKVGADGVLAVSNLALQQGLLLKVADGSEWARNHYIVDVLHHLGWLTETQLNSNKLKPFFDKPLINAQGLIVGAFEPLF